MWNTGDLAHNFYAVGKLYGNDFVNTVIKNGIETAWGMTEREKKALLQIANAESL